jgi:hypothetical protein
VENPQDCTYDPTALVGTSSGDCGTFTEADAAIVRGIWTGPRTRDGRSMWYGLDRGADFMGLSATGGSPLAPRPNPITLDWWRYFLKQDPKWDYATLTRGGYEQAWDQSLEQYGEVLGTDNPNLSAFRDRGGRLILWHGWWDQLIYPRGTIDYYQRVQQTVGGRARTSEFARLFMAPGVAHCGGGPGPAPSGHFEALVRWVEDKRAPDTLDAIRRDQDGAIVRSRKLCQYPMVARYTGKGNTDVAANFVCK